MESYYIPNFITVSRTIVNVMEEYFHMLMIQPGMKPKLPLGFLSAFCPNGGGGGGGGQNEIAWIIEGRSTYLCAKHVANYRGVWGHAPLGNFEFGHFIRRNLADPWTVFA